MSGPDRPELEVLFRISAAVHQVVRDAAGSPRRGDVVAMGADGSPTEELDRVAEAEVLRLLDAEGVDWDLLSEEIGHVRRGGDRTLVVDPIDGSTNALRNLPFSTTSLALGAGTLGGIELGVVRDLYRGTTYWAARGAGAFRDGTPIRTRPWNPKSEMFLLNLGTHATPRTAALAGRVRRVRSLGCASLELLIVAEGAADAYVFENSDESLNLRVTDIAAAYRILVEAGGGVRDANGGSLDAVPLSVGPHTSVLGFGDARFAAAARAGGYL
ncbi:MAG TPA: inositol monophosphatase family protein [Thermoplasmata archaeon]|nr:inositol monophosphatase family protein [Thermoplasmata archaeon]